MSLGGERPFKLLSVKLTVGSWFMKIEIKNVQVLKDKEYVSGKKKKKSKTHKRKSGKGSLEDNTYFLFSS